MDLTALRTVLGELLAPIRQELRSQSAVLSQLSEDLVLLKARFGPVQDLCRKPNSAITRKSTELTPRAPLRRPEEAKRRELVTKSTSEAEKKRQKADFKQPTNSTPRQLPLIRKSLTKPLISQPSNQSPEDCDQVETQSLVEETKSERLEERLQTAESVKTIADFGRNEGLRGVDGQLKELLERYGELVLLEGLPFQISTGARNALCLLGSLDESQFFLIPQNGENEVLWLFRLFFQLCRDPLPQDSSSAWHSLRVFLTSALETGLEDKVLELISSFSFTNENINQLADLLQGQIDRLNPSLYTASSQVAGLLAFPVKEAVAYAGLWPERVQPWRLYQRLLYQRKLSQSL